MIQWLEIAREWRRRSADESPEYGEKDTLTRRFATDKGINASSVRRCSAALAFAETLLAAGKLADVEDLAGVRLEHLNILGRVGRLSLDEAAALLPNVMAKHPTPIKDLRTAEAKLRTTLAYEASSQKGANLLIHRLGAAPFKTAAIDAYAAASRAAGRQAVRLTGRGAIWKAAHVVTRVAPGGPFHAARMVPAVGIETDLSRHAAIAALALALARIFDRFDIVTQSNDDGDAIAEHLRLAGRSGAGVATLAPDGKTLVALHGADRKRKPDLAANYAKDLDARFLAKPKAPKATA